MLLLTNASSKNIYSTYDCFHTIWHKHICVWLLGGGGTTMLKSWFCTQTRPSSSQNIAKPLPKPRRLFGRDKILLIDDLYSPSSSLHLRCVVFASTHHHHATHTGFARCQPDSGWKVDHGPDKLSSSIKTNTFLTKQLSSFSIKAPHWAEAEWERVGQEYLTLYVSLCGYALLSLEEKKKFTPKSSIYDESSQCTAHGAVQKNEHYI